MANTKVTKFGFWPTPPTFHFHLIVCDFIRAAMLYFSAKRSELVSNDVALNLRDFMGCFEKISGSWGILLRGSLIVLFKMQWLLTKNLIILIVPGE